MLEVKHDIQVFIVCQREEQPLLLYTPIQYNCLFKGWIIFHVNSDQSPQFEVFQIERLVFTFKIPQGAGGIVKEAKSGVEVVSVGEHKQNITDPF
jgi:hypothetical protein